MNNRHVAALLVLISYVSTGCCGVNGQRRGDSTRADSNSAPWLPTKATHRAVGTYAGARATVGEGRRPIVLAQHASQLIFIRCDDVECRSYESRRVGRIDRGIFALAWHERSLPLIAYTETSGAPLTLIRCQDPACTASVQEQIAHFDEYNAWRIVTTGPDIVIIARRRDGSLVQLRCPKSSCAAPAISSVTLHNIDQFATSAATDGVWVFGVSPSRESLEIARCTESECLPASANVVPHDQHEVALQVAAPASTSTSVTAAMTLTAYDHNRGLGVSSLRSITCSNLECVATDIAAFAENTTYVELAVRSDGLPVLALTNRGDEGSRILLCQDSQCRSSRAIDLGEGAVYAITVADDWPVIVSAARTDGILKLTRCTEATCEKAAVATIDLRPIAEGRDGVETR